MSMIDEQECYQCDAGLCWSGGRVLNGKCWRRTSGGLIKIAAKRSAPRIFAWLSFLRSVAEKSRFRYSALVTD
jgi:hypothetical protein